MTAKSSRAVLAWRNSSAGATREKCACPTRCRIQKAPQSATIKVMDALKEWAKGIIQSYGLGGLFGIAFIESSFFPIPPDVFMIGLLLTPNAPTPFITALICTIGSVLGAAFGW